MSIATNITNLVNAIATTDERRKGIITAIAAKGVTMDEGATLKECVGGVGKIAYGGDATEELRQILNRTIAGCDIKEGVTKIREHAFSECTLLEQVSIPSSVTSIKDSVFYHCYLLKTVIIKAVTPPALTSSIFSSCPISSIYVPDESVSDYQGATNWITYKDYIKPMSQKDTTV